MAGSAGSSRSPTSAPTNAGWGAGQLDGELEQEAWVVAPAEAEDPFRAGDMWSSALERRGGAYRLLATMPPDPSQN